MYHSVGVAAKTGYILAQAFQRQLVDALGIDIDDNALQTTAIERPYQKTSGFAITANQIKRLADSLYIAGKPLFGNCTAKSRILDQRKNGADGIKPGDHGDVNHRGCPQALSIGKDIGNLAKAYGRAHKADKIKSVEKIKSPGISRIVNPWDQYQAANGNRVSADKHYQRCAHTAKKEKKNGRHRGTV